MKKLLSLFGIFALCFILTGCVDPSEVSNVQGEYDSSTTQETFKMNEDVFLKRDDGEIRLRITSIWETSKRNSLVDERADRVIIIEYEYENISRPSLYISSTSFTVYGKDNIPLARYPATESKSPTNISMGRRTTASAAYALNNKHNYVELEFRDNRLGTTADVKFILEW